MLDKLLRRLLPNSRATLDESSPAALREYMACRTKVDKSAALGEVRFVVFDTETSGLDLATNKLLSIAGVGVTNLEVRMDDAFDAIVRQHDVGGAQAAVVHGMVSGDLVDGLTELEAASNFLSFVGTSVLVAHHAAFDVRMLRKAIGALPGAKVWSAVVDTAHLARRVEVGPMSSEAARGVDDSGSYRLDDLVDRYGIEVPDRHTASGDALATALLFQRLLRKADRRGIRTLGELLR